MGALIAAIGVFAPSQAASIHDHPHKPDTGSHSYCFKAAFTNGWKPYANAALNNLMDQTIVEVSYNTSCETSNIDVRYGLAPPEADYFGRNSCLPGWLNTVNGVDVCGSSNIDMGATAILATPSPGAQATKTSCHELGHSVGIRHYNSGDNPITVVPGYPGSIDCMRSGVWTTGWNNGIGEWDQYHWHHVVHINDWFN
ncbi:hypothetical protein [Nocardioides zeae]